MVEECYTRNMKNLLITGEAGYIGSVLSAQLIEKSYKVKCEDKLDFGSVSLESLKKNDNFEFHNIDINNFNEFEKNIKK